MSEISQQGSVLTALRPNKQILIHAIVILIAVVPLTVLLVRQLALKDVIAILVYPLVLTYGAAILMERGLRRAVRVLKSDLNHTTQAFISLIGKNRIVCHGTKYNVPNAHEFWNDLLVSANRQFFLTGRSNKSWINKTREQSDRLGSAMIRIIENGGSIKILSHGEPEFIEATKRFVTEYITPKLREYPAHKREELADKFEGHFLYSTCAQTNYSAVVSDDRLVIMPTPNSKEFRDDALVFELSRQLTPFEFHNYMSDIDRIFSRESEKVPLRWRTMLFERAESRP